KSRTYLCLLKEISPYRRNKRRRDFVTFVYCGGRISPSGGAPTRADRSRWTSASVLPRVRRTSSGEREKAPVLSAPGPFATPPRRSNASGSSGSSRPAGGPAPTTPGRAGSVRRPPPACRRQRSRSGPRRRSLRPFPTGAECVVGQERGAVVAERLPDGLGVGPVDLQSTAPVRD